MRIMPLEGYNPITNSHDESLVLTDHSDLESLRDGSLLLSIYSKLERYFPKDKMKFTFMPGITSDFKLFDRFALNLGGVKFSLSKFDNSVKDYQIGVSYFDSDKSEFYSQASSYDLINTMIYLQGISLEDLNIGSNDKYSDNELIKLFNLEKYGLQLEKFIMNNCEELTLTFRLIRSIVNVRVSVVEFYVSENVMPRRILGKLAIIFEKVHRNYLIKFRSHDNIIGYEMTGRDEFINTLKTLITAVLNF